jgi:hypothetical protein
MPSLVSLRSTYTNISTTSSVSYSSSQSAQNARKRIVGSGRWMRCFKLFNRAVDMLLLQNDIGFRSPAWHCNNNQSLGQRHIMQRISGFGFTVNSNAPST